MDNQFKTIQEAFWAGKFGDDYIGRNESREYLASNLSFFVNTFKKADKISSLIEFGANIGMNLRAIRLLFPSMDISAIEINGKAAKILTDFLGEGKVYKESILDYSSPGKFDLVLIKGVLIHINPDMLGVVYDKLYNASNRYILIAEYYNPSPVSINYRGHEDRLFKRDFAGEMLDRYKTLQLIDYGFVYRRDRKFPQDDITWFLLEKNEEI